MLGNGAAKVAIALLLASTEQSELDPLAALLQWLKDLMPPWLWAVLFIGVALCLFVLDIGDKLSGIFGSPFQRSQPSTDQLELIRQKLLKIVKKEVNLRLANSLHNLVKLDLYMEDQRERVGSPKLELVPEDSPKDNEPSFQSVNRVLHPKGGKPPLNLKLTQKIIDVFERQDIQGRLLILGDPGSGKTTELLQLTRDLVTRVEKDDQHPVPVLLELSSWNGESVEHWTISQLKKLYSLSESTVKQWLANNQILLMLDGLDELGLTKQRQCIEKINQFLETTRTSELVVCCRREEYETGQIDLAALNGAVYLEALKEEQIREYFEKLNRLSLWENIRGNQTLRELAQKPLFLSMLVVAYQGKPIQNQQELLKTYIEKQLYVPSNQGTYKPGKEPTPQETRHYLVWLAKQLDNAREAEFLIEGLQPTWLSSMKQIRLYRLVVGLIVGLSIGLTVGLLNGPISWLGFGLFGGLLGGLLGRLNFGLLSGLIYVSATEKETPNQSIKKSMQNALYNGLLGGLYVWLGGLSFGITVGVYAIQLFGEIFWPIGALIGGMNGGLTAAIQHFILRIFLTKEGSIPWNYARFLDHAVKHRFIQRIGGRYRFMHDLLRKHFAAMPLE